MQSGLFWLLVLSLLAVVVLSSFSYADIPPPPPAPSLGGSSGGVQESPPFEPQNFEQPKANVSASSSGKKAVKTNKSQASEASPLTRETIPKGSSASSEVGLSAEVRSLDSRVSRLQLLLFASLFLDVVLVVLLVVLILVFRSGRKKERAAGVNSRSVNSAGVDLVDSRAAALRDYARNYLNQGYRLESIREHLLNQGYDKELVDMALSDG